MGVRHRIHGRQTGKRSARNGPDSEEALWLNDRIREYRRKIGKHRWAKVVDRAGDNVQVLVLAKILDVAAKWLFGEPRAIDVSKRDSSSPGE